MKKARDAHVTLDLFELEHRSRKKGYKEQYTYWQMNSGKWKRAVAGATEEREKKRSVECHFM